MPGCLLRECRCFNFFYSCQAAPSDDVHTSIKKINNENLSDERMMEMNFPKVAY